MTINVDGKFLTPPEHAAEDHTDIAASVVGAADAGAASGAQPTIRIIAGSNVTVGFTEDIPGNELEFTISATGGTPFPGFGGTPPQDASSGSAGSSGTASRSDHSHPSSTTYTNRDGTEAAAHQFSGTTTFAFSYSALGTSSTFRPRVMFNSFFTPNQTGMGVAFTTTPSTQRYSVIVNAQANITNGFFGNFNGTDMWRATVISTTGATIQHTVGAATALGTIILNSMNSSSVPMKNTGNFRHVWSTCRNP